MRDWTLRHEVKYFVEKKSDFISVDNVTAGKVEVSRTKIVGV